MLPLILGFAYALSEVLINPKALLVFKAPLWLFWVWKWNGVSPIGASKSRA